MKKYELYFGDLHIGSIVEDEDEGDGDVIIRNSGTISYHFDYLNTKGEQEKLARSISSSIRLCDIDELGDCEEYKKACEEEEEFIDIIESDDWYMIRSDGKKVKILCPIFKSDNEVVWQED